MGNYTSSNALSHREISSTYVTTLDNAILRFLKQHCTIKHGGFVDQGVLCDAFMQFENVKMDGPSWVSRIDLLNQITKIANAHYEPPLTFFHSSQSKLVINILLISFPTQLDGHSVGKTAV
jgi:hypothetical protein